MVQAEIGLVGLGVMGSNLALNIAEKGQVIAVSNRTSERTGAFFEAAGDLRQRIVPCAGLEELVRAIRPPRPVIIMVQAGDPVDQQIAALLPLHSKGDLLIDAGNANYRDTVRRIAALEGSGVDFLGVGVSGGEEGARLGPSIMAGGRAEAYRRVEPVLTAIAARYNGDACSAWVGPDGAGHFVKTIHNGIEYADMQMIAEIYAILRDGLGRSAGEMAALFEQWNEGRLNSFLIEITASVLSAADPMTGKPIVDVIRDTAGQKGTGRWAAIEAQELGIPATAIESAVAARSLSALKGERGHAAGLYETSTRRIEGGIDTAILEAALYAAKIAAYAQGFAVMQGASTTHGWQLPMSTIARIWRAGCIIRSIFLDAIASAYDRDAALPNLLVAESFIPSIRETEGALRQTVSAAVLAGIPVPALSAALAYLDDYRRPRGTADLIQAQRDFFGAHGFERLDIDGHHHGPWGMPG